MVGGKRRRTKSFVQVLDEKDLKKIQQLIEAHSDDEEQPNNWKLTFDYDITNADIPTRSDPQPSSFTEHEDHIKNMEQDQVWAKFFKGSQKDVEQYSEVYLKKIKDCESEIGDALSEYVGSIPGEIEALARTEHIDDLPAELRDHLKLLVDVLKNYRSGPLPKTVKMLPHLPGWDGLLEMLNPADWTVHAHQRVTRVFASKGHEQASHYYENYLLPKILSDIRENNRLDMHLFEALITALFRPMEFISGIFAPWISSEMGKADGLVLANLIKRASIKAHFAAVAMALLLEEPFSIPRSMVLEAILNKKYRLPESAIGYLVKYFTSFDSDSVRQYFVPEGYLPVTWFRSLLSFIELYRDAISPAERTDLFSLCRRHQHPAMTPELRSLLSLVPTGDSGVPAHAIHISDCANAP